MQEDQMELAQRQADMAIAKGVAMARGNLLSEKGPTMECVDCDKPIPEARRLILPETQHCIGCATGIEARRRRR